MSAAFPSRPFRLVSRALRSSWSKKIFLLRLPRSSLLTDFGVIAEAEISRGALGTGLLGMQGEVLWSSTYGSSKGSPWGACPGAGRGCGECGWVQVSHELRNRESRGVSALRAWITRSQQQVSWRRAAAWSESFQLASQRPVPKANICISSASRVVSLRNGFLLQGTGGASGSCGFPPIHLCRVSSAALQTWKCACNLMSLQQERKPTVPELRGWLSSFGSGLHVMVKLKLGTFRLREITPRYCKRLKGQLFFSAYVPLKTTNMWESCSSRE